MLDKLNEKPVYARDRAAGKKLYYYTGRSFKHIFYNAFIHIIGSFWNFKCTLVLYFKIYNFFCGVVIKNALIINENYTLHLFTDIDASQLNISFFFSVRFRDEFSYTFEFKF